MDAISTVNLFLLIGALIVVAGIASSLLASRFGAPLLLVFLALGMLAGENGPGGLRFDNYQLTYLIGSLAIAIILFDGGLRTPFAGFRGVFVAAGMLSTVGVLITTALTGAVASLVFGIGWIEGLLIGAIVASTDSAAVFFLIRAGGLHLRRRVKATLELESGTNDPVAVFLTIALVQILLEGDSDAGGAVLSTLASQFLIGGAMGAGGGLAIVFVLNRVALPSGLHPILVVASAVLVFSLTSFLGGSGFLAAYLAGLALANRPVRAFASILSFHDAATWLCQLAMFVVLGLLVTPANLLDQGLPALVIAMFLMLVGRPIAVWLCLWPFRFSANEKAFVSWVGLRGAVSIFLAAIPVLTGLPGGEIYFNVAFVVVLISLVVQGWTITSVARRLDLALPDAAPDVQRIEIDIPGQLNLEMVGYPVSTGSPILQRERLPGWLKPVLVVRDDEILQPEQAGRLAGGDYWYFLMSPSRVPQADALFSAPDATELKTPVGFALGGDSRVRDVGAFYGLPVDERDQPLTLSETFQRRFPGGGDVGDHFDMGDARIVATAVEDNKVVDVRLETDSRPDAPPARPGRWPPLRRLLGRLAR